MLPGSPPETTTAAGADPWEEGADGCAAAADAVAAPLTAAGEGDETGVSGTAAVTGDVGDVVVVAEVGCGCGWGTVAGAVVVVAVVDAGDVVAVADDYTVAAPDDSREDAAVSHQAGELCCTDHQVAGAAARPRAAPGCVVSVPHCRGQNEGAGHYGVVHGAVVLSEAVPAAGARHREGGGGAGGGCEGAGRAVAGVRDATG